MTALQPDMFDQNRLSKLTKKGEMRLLGVQPGTTKQTGAPGEGHYAVPGSGPKGETCNSCRFRVSGLIEDKRRKSGFYPVIRCQKTRDHWNGVRMWVQDEDPACKGWEAAE